jgi:hypothetical protein
MLLRRLILPCLQQGLHHSEIGSMTYSTETHRIFAALTRTFQDEENIHVSIFRLINY